MDNLQIRHDNLYPHKKIIVNKNETIKEIIINSVLRSLRFCSKVIGKCEFTDKQYDKSEEENFSMITLESVKQVNNHHCSGNLNVHKENLKYEDLANKIFECLYFLIKKHSLQGKVINIERSNGEIVKANVLRDSIIRYREEDENLYLYVEFEDNGECKNKLISFNDRISQSRGDLTQGIISLNQQLFENNNILYLTLSNFPKELEDISNLYYNLITREFDKLKIKYEFKYV